MGDPAFMDTFGSKAKTTLKFLFPEWKLVENVLQDGLYRGSHLTVGIFSNHSDTMGIVNHGGKAERMMGQNDFCMENARSNAVMQWKSHLSVPPEEFRLVGQDEAMKKILRALQRPILTGFDADKAKGVMVISGQEGMGRHSLLYAGLLTIAKENEIYMNHGYIDLDLAKYDTAAKKDNFMTDLYDAFYGPAEFVVLDHLEACHSSFQAVLLGMVRHGIYELEGRYVQRNQMLVQANGVLASGMISQIGVNQKFIVFLTEKDMQGFAESAGGSFIDDVEDFVCLDDYSVDELKAILEQLLDACLEQCRQKLSLHVRMNDEVRAFFAAAYTERDGICGLKEYLQNKLYRGLTEYKLQNPSCTEVSVYMEDDILMMGQGEDKSRLSELLPVRIEYHLQEIERSLSDVIGLKTVKEYLEGLRDMLVIQKRRQMEGEKVVPIVKHMVFMGNPGTGKTMIARLVAKYLKALGILSGGQLVEVSRVDLVGQYVGQTAKLTASVIRSALGGVLFIDEAYALCRGKYDSFRHEAVDTLVKGMEDYHEDLVVILAGYGDEMKNFLKSNPGLQSRFPNILEFADYTAEEMYKIAQMTAAYEGYEIAADSKRTLLDFFQLRQSLGEKDEGNGRLVRNVVEKAILRQAKRLLQEGEPSRKGAASILESCDLVPEGQATKKTFDLEIAMQNVVGLEKVKDYLRHLQARLEIEKERKEVGLELDTTQSLHMVFMGNPGTGKTMMARLTARMLHEIGLLKTDKLVETDRSGLVAGYVGQTALKTRKKVEEAMDGVLFIDEAYALAKGGPNDFGHEAVDILVKLMDDYRERLVVILAGYTQEMKDCLRMNPGLRSRFPHVIEFADYGLEDLLDIMNRLCEARGYVLSHGCRYGLQRIFAAAEKQQDFGNGRYVRNILEGAINNQALRLSRKTAHTREELVTIEPEDLEEL